MKEFNLLCEILERKHIRTVFQPIVSLENGNVFGYEALSRITLPSCEVNIEQLFELAFKMEKLWDLEQLCRICALESAMKQSNNKTIFLNVDANIIHDPTFKIGFTNEKLEKYGLFPENIVFEITEKSAISDMDAFIASVKHYQNQEFQIAIDDFGSGHSGLNRVCAFSPHFLKIDMNLVRDIDSDLKKQSAVGAIVGFCKQSNIKIIAEGIETLEELQTLIRMGVDMGQGYYLGRPKEDFYLINKRKKQEIKEIYNKSKLFYRPFIFNKVVDLGEKKQTVTLYEKSKTIYDQICHNLSISEFFVLDENEQVKGVLTRTRLAEKFSGQFGYNLSSRTTAQDLMLKNFLCVEESMPIDQVSELAMERSQEAIYDAIAVVKNGKYICTVTVKNLLLASIRLQVERAADANPLTGLPGNNQIQQVIASTFSQDINWSILYFDLDNFKAYNDAYGFSSGDLMIKILAKTLITCSHKTSFCGHIGGDDFVVISYTHSIEKMCNDICQAFKKSIKALYSPFDWEQGFITSKNRHGFTENFPIATLSIAAVTNKHVQPKSMEELSHIIADTKKKSKQQEGDSIIIV